MGLQVLTDNVNLMVMNLTDQVRSIAEVTKAVASGDLTKTIELDVRGEILDLKENVNEMTETLRNFVVEVTRVVREFGTDGHLGCRANVMNIGGTWKVRLCHFKENLFKFFWTLGLDGLCEHDGC